jgi:hypothetical protein
VERLLDALDVAGAFTHHLLACAQQVASAAADWVGWSGTKLARISP